MQLNAKSQAPLNHIDLVFLYTTSMSIGERIRQIRESHKLSGEAFGDLCGVSKGMVSQWENNIVTPPMDRLLLLREKFDFSFDWLVDGTIDDYSKKLRPPLKALLEVAEKLPDTEVAELTHQGGVFIKLITHKSEGINGAQ